MVQQTWLRTPRKRLGFSAVEVVVASLVTGVVVAASLASVGGALRTRKKASDLTTGPVLAEQLLAEIVAMPYEDPENPGSTNGTESGEGTTSRTDFDDVDDYDDWDMASAEDKTGNPIAIGAGWRREVDVWWAERIMGNVWFMYDTGLKRIRVRVTSPSGEVTERIGFRGEHGTLQQAPQVDTTVVTWIEATVQRSGTTAHAAGSLQNHAADPNTP